MQNESHDIQMLLQLKIKCRVVQRLTKEVQFRKAELSTQETQLADIQAAKPIDKHEVKKFKGFIQESKETLDVTYKALEVACQNVQDLISNEFITELNAVSQDTTTKDSMIMPDETMTPENIKLQEVSEIHDLIKETIAALQLAVLERPDIVLTILQQVENESKMTSLPERLPTIKQSIGSMSFAEVPDEF